MTQQVIITADQRSWRQRAAAVVATVALALVGIGVALPASAATVDSFTLSANSTPRSSTVTATFTATATSSGINALTIAMPSELAAGATWTSVVGSGTGGPVNCVVGPPEEAACEWGTATVGATLTVTATLDVGASSTPGSYSLTATALSTDAPASTSQTLEVVDAPAVLDPIGDQNVAEGSSLVIPLSASDADGDPVALATGPLPAFVTFSPGPTASPTSGSLTVNPTLADAGTYSIQVIASGSGFDTETFTLTVTNTNQDPFIAPIGAQVVDEGQSLTVNVAVTDPDGTVPSIAVPGLPSFATIVYDTATATATITANPGFSDSGSYDITVYAVDFDGGTSQQTFTLTVNNVNRAPVLAAIGDQTVAEDGSLTVTVSATDPDGDALSFLPSGLPGYASFTDNGDGTGTLTLTPGYADAGTDTITMLVTDSFLDDTEDFTVTVTNTNRDPVLDPIDTQVIADGTTASLTVSATDPDGDAIALTVGSLPSWASFVDNGDGTGTFTFTPGTADVGSFWDILVVADDGSAGSDSRRFEAYVVDVDAPVIFVPTDITVTATGSNGATVTYAVSAQDAVDGALVPDCLPPSGSTFAVGTTTVSCTVTDLDGNESAAEFTVTVLPQAGSGGGGGNPGGGGAGNPGGGGAGGAGGESAVDEPGGALASTGANAPWGVALLASALVVLGGWLVARRRLS